MTMMQSLIHRRRNIRKILSGWHNCFNVRAAKCRDYRMPWHEGYITIHTIESERLTQLAQWADQNNINLNVGKTFSLEEAGKALDYL